MASPSKQPGPSLWNEAPEVHEGPVARVAMVAAVEGEYSFSVPPELADRVEPGRRLLVPFGRNRRPQPAFCIAVGREAWTTTLKPVAEVVDEAPLLSPALLELGQWIARYYCCPLGRALAAMVPDPIRKQSGFVTIRRLVLNPVVNADGTAPGGPSLQRWGSESGSDPLPSPAIGKTSHSGGTGSSSARTLADKPPVPPEAPRTMAQPSSSEGVQDAAPARRSRKQQAVLETLAAEPTGLDLDDLLIRTGASKGVVGKLLKAGLIRQELRREAPPAPDFDQPGPEPSFDLNHHQQTAITRISELALQRAFRAVLLFGVSGSGKTEVYIRTIRSVVAAGRQAILLVPEITLTTQMVDRLASRFEHVAVIHSGLTGVHRSLTWTAIARGEKRVIIGTRSAVFAPCPDLGLIIVDEEQESSYKNQQSPRFHTRDVAIKRAQMASVPIVLGSATPSLEMWHNCGRLSHFEKITLPERIAGLPMPEVRFVDMNIEQRHRKGLHLLSEEMEKELADTLAAGQQAVLLLNRRGYASYLMCSRCRNPIVCPNCRANMVFHQSTGKALCHYCSAKMVVPTRCGNPSCAGTLIRFGMGTQRVEEELQSKFPQARVARADSDTLTHARHYAQVLHDFAEGRTQVLIGTQMIAKGLDFPNVHFVGVVNADTALSIPDFRAAERTFQLVTQVAGRAGRAGSQGRVVVQSLAGLCPALQFAANHDFASFAQHELDIRKRLHWPPFARLARLVLSHSSQSQASGEAKALAERVREFLTTHALPADVLGPQSCPLSRLRSQYRYDFIIRAANAAGLMQVLDRLRNDGILTPSTKRVLIDVDPMSLL